MKVVSLIRRCIRAAAGLHGTAVLDLRPGLHGDMPVRAASRAVDDRAGRGPVVRWHLNPVTDRLECRWISAGDVAADPHVPSFFEQLGLSLAVYYDGRARG